MPLKTQLDEAPAINLTPMIDVVFLLIIFFMVGTKFSEIERKIRIQVPQVSDAGALTAAPQRRVINVHGDGRVVLDERPVTLDELAATLGAARRQYQDLGVLIRGDAEGSFQNVASVLNACRRAGIRDMGVSVQPIVVRR